MIMNKPGKWHNTASGGIKARLADSDGSMM
jgi:hypothetical protein